MKVVFPKSVLFFLLLISPLTVVSSVVFGEEEWIVEEVFTSPLPHVSTDLVLDSAGEPHLAFVQGNRLIYATKESGLWSLDTLRGSATSSVSIDLFSSDVPAFSFVEKLPPYEVGYMSYNGSSWFTESLGIVYNGTIETHLAIDSEDIPRVLRHTFVYVNPYNAGTTLYFDTRGASGWESDEILRYNTTAEGVIGNFDLELTQDNQPRVIYSLYYGRSSSLDFAWPEERPQYWNWRSVVGGLDVENDNSLDLDPSGVSHCSFSRFSNLYYATGGCEGFTVELVDPEDGVANYSDVQADILGNPHIVYDSPAGLIYATRSGSAWEFCNLGTPMCTVRDPSICIDSSGYPHIAWVETDTHRVMYAHFGEASGISDLSPQISHIELHGIFPNPVNTSANAKFSLEVPGRVCQQVYSIDGRLVWEESFNSPSGELSSRLPALDIGLYIYRISALNLAETECFTVCN